MPLTKEKIFLVDVDKCDGCRECMKACSLKHFGVDSAEHSRIRIEEFPEANLHVPVLCQACEESLCIKVCPMNARKKLDSGAVVTDEERCIRCRTCVYVCPIGAPTENPESGKLMTCDRCMEDEEIPLCALACAKQKALKFIEARHAAQKTARQCAARFKKAYRPIKTENNQEADS